MKKRTKTEIHRLIKKAGRGRRHLGASEDSHTARGVKMLEYAKEQARAAQREIRAGNCRVGLTHLLAARGGSAAATAHSSSGGRMSTGNTITDVEEAYRMFTTRCTVSQKRFGGR